MQGYVLRMEQMSMNIVRKWQPFMLHALQNILINSFCRCFYFMKLISMQRQRKLLFHTLIFYSVTGETALHVCASRGLVDLIQYLTLRGANIDAVNNSGETPLMTACRSAQVRRFCC